MSWLDHTPDCWTTTPPDNGPLSGGANAGYRWLLPPHNGKYDPIPVIASLNFNACVGVDYWSCDLFPESLAQHGLTFPNGDDLAAAGYRFGPKVLGPLETIEAENLRRHNPHDDQHGSHSDR